MQQMIFIADLIACSTCFGHHYAHHQELENIMCSCSTAVLQTCMTYTTAECTVNKLLMMDRRTVQNM